MYRADNVIRTCRAGGGGEGQQLRRALLRHAGQQRHRPPHVFALVVPLQRCSHQLLRRWSRLCRSTLRSLDDEWSVSGSDEQQHVMPAGVQLRDAAMYISHVQPHILRA